MPKNVDLSSKGWTITEDTLPNGNKIFLSKNSQTGEIIKNSTRKNAIEMIRLEKESYKRHIEAFDISGKVDISNPIYRFYEKEVQKFLKRIYPDMKRITDPQGVEWFEINIKPEMGKAPIEAFGVIPFIGALQKKQKEYNKKTTIPFMNKTKQPLFINK